jgi:titin
VGGTATGSANVISGNGAFGVYLYGSRASGNVVLGNRIGTDVSGTLGLGNAQDGVFLEQGASANTLGGTAAGAGNVIAFNVKGVVIGSGPADTTTTHDWVLGNSIFGNASLGIDLGNNGFTPNGTNPRACPNDGQNAPVVTAVTATSVSGTLTTANGTYRVELFASPFGSTLQGKTFLGFVNVTVTARSKSFTATGLSVPAGSIVTATATNLATGDTSEFSQLATAVWVSSNPVITRSSGAQTVMLSAALTGPGPGRTGTVTFTIAGLPGSVTVNVGRSGVATATFTVPANVVGTFKIIATYASGGGSFTDSTSTPLYDGVLTVKAPAVIGRRVGGPRAS